MLRIVTDGAADMPAAWEQEFDIQVIPIKVNVIDQGEARFMIGMNAAVKIHVN